MRQPSPKQVKKPSPVKVSARTEPSEIHVGQIDTGAITTVEDVMRLGPKTEQGASTAAIMESLRADAEAKAVKAKEVEAKPKP